MSEADGICSDCGVQPIHPDSLASYCRQCSERAGHHYLFKTEIDHDKLRARLGIMLPHFMKSYVPKLVEDLIKTCKAEW
jgi:hypothetical protein